MSEKYKNKYRTESTRLKKWNYGWAAAYFITICTKNRIPYFGQVKNGKTELSAIGIIVDILWHETINHAKNIELGEFIVMPNHIHNILILNPDNMIETRHALSQRHPPPQRDSPSERNPPFQRDPPPERNPPFQRDPPPERNPPFQRLGNPENGEKTENGKNNNEEKTETQKRFRNQGKNTVSSIIGGYKSAVTKHARRLGFQFAWQPRFWDHVIRNERAHHQIAQYIINNPQKWEEDRLNGGAGNKVLS